MVEKLITDVGKWKMFTSPETDSWRSTRKWNKENLGKKRNRREITPYQIGTYEFGKSLKRKK
jgi:hypothetical protein